MCIGTTILLTYPKASLAVYPYVYREHAHVNSKEDFISGFIPMCIGNTGQASVIKHIIAVYPYVYREHYWAML